jgi:uncharacterized alkaline shock family protein YloU
MTADRWNTLPCGRDPQRLLDHAAERTSPPVGSHEATCPYCQATIGELGQLWNPVRSWAQAPTPLPPGLLPAILTRIRKLVQSPHHVAETTADGATTVTSWVLGLIAVIATQNTPGVTSITKPSLSRPHRVTRNRRQEIRYGADGVDISEVNAAAIGVSLGITAEGGRSLSLLADTIRQNIILAIRNETAIEVSEVDVTVDDIIPPSP